MQRKLVLCNVLLLIANIAFADGHSNIEINDAWIKQSPPTLSISAAYLNLVNNTDQSLVLQTVSSPDFAKIEIHKTIVSNDLARMEKQKTIIIPAGANHAFSPGGYHLMLFEPKRPLRIGDTKTIHFAFANGTIKTIVFVVKRLDSTDHLQRHDH